MLRLLRYVSSFSAFTQIVVGLPLVWDVLGQESFLLLSLFLAAYQTSSTSLHLALKNTRWAGAVTFLNAVGTVVPLLLLSLIFYLHLRPPSPGSWSSWLYQGLPPLWSSFLRACSPAFIVMEGLASLLVCQALGKTTKGWLEEGEREGRDVRGLLVLVLSSTTYVVAITALVQIFPPPPESSSVPSLLLGVALTSTAFLTVIGFSLRRTNVVETSLIMAYVTWSIWLLDVEGGSYAAGSEGWLVGKGRQPGWEAGMDVGGLMGFALSQVKDVVFGLISSLPLPLLIALVFRVGVLHAASRIILFIRKGWDDSSSDGDSSFYDGQHLSDEPPSARITTVILSYRRAILIAVYTHLLLMDHSQVWWRWVSIGCFLVVWAAELVFDADEDDGAPSMSLAKEWKVD